jgi:hypothetical protein
MMVLFKNFRFLRRNLSGINRRLLAQLKVIAPNSKARKGLIVAADVDDGWYRQHKKRCLDLSTDNSRFL